MNIPSILISDSDGERLMNLSQRYPGLSLKIIFDTQKSEKVNLTIYTEGSKDWVIETIDSATISSDPSQSTTPRSRSKST